jgi:ribosomal-protein-alanine N-acetyltransferase
MMPAETTITIRRLAIEDLDAALALDERSFGSPWTRNNYKFEITENEAGLPLAAFDQTGMLIGVGVFWLLVDEIHVATIAIETSYRRQGIASRLMCAGFRELAGQGAQTAALEVRVGNLPAQQLYQRFGFKEVGRRKHYYRDNGEDAILMTAFSLRPALAFCTDQD